MRYVICKGIAAEELRVVMVVSVPAPSGMVAVTIEALPGFSMAADPDGLADLRDYVRVEDGRVTFAWPS